MSAVDLALLIVRVAVGVIMVAHGLNHWRGGGKIAGTAGWFSSLGLRYGVLQAWTSVLVEIGSGVLLVLGLITPVAAAAVVSVMLVAGLLYHRDKGFFIFKEGYEYVLLVGLVALALGALGPGRVSIDHAAGIEMTGWTGLVVDLVVGVVATAGLLVATWRPVRQPAQ
jgi:putative oxidoreductase